MPNSNSPQPKLKKFPIGLLKAIVSTEIVGMENSLTYYKEGEYYEMYCQLNRQLKADNKIKKSKNLIPEKTTIQHKLTISDFNKKKSAGINYLELKENIIKKYFKDQEYIVGKTKNGKMKIAKITQICIEPRFCGKWTIYCNVCGVFSDQFFDSTEDCIELINRILELIEK